MPEPDIFDGLLGVSGLRDKHLRQSRPLASWQAVSVRLVYDNQTVAPKAAAEFLTRLQYHLENPVPLTSIQSLARKDSVQFIID